MSDETLSPLEQILRGQRPSEPEVPVAPAPVEKKPTYKRDATKLKELEAMILKRDHRLNGRSQREFEHQFELDWDAISALFAEYPEVMRFQTHSRLWSIHPDAES